MSKKVVTKQELKDILFIAATDTPNYECKVKADKMLNFINNIIEDNFDIWEEEDEKKTQDGYEKA